MALQVSLMSQMQFVRRLADFINEKYPNVNSLKELDLEKANIQWVDWLDNLNIPITIKQVNDSKIYGKDLYYKTPAANFLESTIKYFNVLTDEREEWEKDKWDVRKLEKYGITYNKSLPYYYIDFIKVNNYKIRKILKIYKTKVDF